MRGHGDEKPSDEQLLGRVARGDDAAFSALYRRYLPLVVRWCLRETGNRELAADLAAEVFATLLTQSNSHRPERGSVVGWLLGIARNKLRESRRRGRVESSARRRLGIATTQITDEDLERVDELASRDEEILARMADLPEEQRAALIERVVQERSYEEIASEMRCSQAVARQRVSRGLRTLRAQMEEL